MHASSSQKTASNFLQKQFAQNFFLPIKLPGTSSWSSSGSPSSSRVSSNPNHHVIDFRCYFRQLVDRASFFAHPLKNVADRGLTALFDFLMGRKKFSVFFACCPKLNFRRRRRRCPWSLSLVIIQGILEERLHVFLFSRLRLPWKTFE